MSRHPIIEALKKTPCWALNPQLWEESPKEGKRGKYGAVAVVIDDIRFMSIREGKRYRTLKYLVRVGEISPLCLQMPYELNPGGTHSLIYRADFVYRDLKTGELVVEDCKGARTETYKKKRTLMLKVHGITILET